MAYLQAFKKALTQGMEDSIQANGSPADVALWNQTNQQYSNLKTLLPLVAKATDATGISPQGLLNAVTNNGFGKQAMATGTRGTLGDLAQISNGLLKNQVNDSGTPLRLLAMKALGGLGLAGVGTAAGGAPAILPALAGGAIGGRILNSPALARLAMNRFAAGPATIPMAARLGSLGVPFARGLPFNPAPAPLTTQQQGSP